MKFKYIGENGSMGYKNGQVYDIEPIPFSPYPFAIQTSEPDGTEACPYSGFQKFFENWELIKPPTP